MRPRGAMRIRARVCAAVTLAWALASAAHATDVAYWQPYQSDDHTYLLCAFDGSRPAEVQGFAKAAAAELLGGAAFESDGRFGGSLRVGGAGGKRSHGDASSQGNQGDAGSQGSQGGLRIVPTAVFPAATWRSKRGSSSRVIRRSKAASSSAAR